MDEDFYLNGLEPDHLFVCLLVAFDDQLYAPTTLAPARDFWLLRYTSVLEDGSLVVNDSKNSYPNFFI